MRSKETKMIFASDFLDEIIMRSNEAKMIPVCKDEFIKDQDYL